jgi:hypothetical protein
MTEGSDSVCRHVSAGKWLLMTKRRNRLIPDHTSEYMAP